MTERKHIVVIGGSVSGLGLALALTKRGHNVTVLEKDATPMPATPGEAFEKWDRKGSPQTRHSHALLARLHNLIRDHAPDLLEKLLACGAEELKFTDRIGQLFDDPQLEEGDEDIVFLACRRITFEWVLRHHVIDSGLVEFRDGVSVTGLSSSRDDPSGLPRVTGVRVAETRADAGVVQRRDRLCLALEPLETRRRAWELWRQHLERNEAIELRVPRSIYDAHAAAPNLVRDLELVELRAGWQEWLAGFGSGLP